MKNILIVEDETKLRQELKSFLETNGYKVSTITSFANTLEEIIHNHSDLILLDINLPNMNGEYLCHEIRKKEETPIIIVTSRNNELDELISINYGADDFIVKPYNPQILLARINRLLNRNNPINETIAYKNLSLDISKSIITHNNQSIDLSKNEFRILYYLLKNQNHIISRDELINYLWDNNEFIDDNTLTVNITRLRNKLEQLGYKDMIITKRGQGYLII